MSRSLFQKELLGNKSPPKGVSNEFPTDSRCLNSNNTAHLQKITIFLCSIMLTDGLSAKLVTLLDEKTHTKETNS